MFNIPEPEIHDRVIIISFFFFPKEAEASSIAGNLLHFQIASPASPLETVPFLYLTCLWILRQEAAPRGSKEPARDSPAPRLVSSISLLQQGGRGAVPAPHPHRLGVSKLSECTGLALLQPGSATGTMLGVCARHTPVPFPTPAEADSTRCAAEPDRARLSPITARLQEPSPWVSRWQGSHRGSLLCIFHPRAALAAGRGRAHSATPLF